jgi:translocation and assembly module TamB
VMISAYSRRLMYLPAASAVPAPVCGSAGRMRNLSSPVARRTALAAGKYINRRLYAEIITDGQGYSATRVEFQVTRWLSLLSTISNIGRQSANVRVSKDY